MFEPGSVLLYHPTNSIAVCTWSNGVNFQVIFKQGNAPIFDRNTTYFSVIEKFDTWERGLQSDTFRNQVITKK